MVQQAKVLKKHPCLHLKLYENLEINLVAVTATYLEKFLIIFPGTPSLSTSFTNYSPYP
jgi:hypothetical protein